MLPATDPARGDMDDIKTREARIVVLNVTTVWATLKPSGSLIGVTVPADVHVVIISVCKCLRILELSRSLCGVHVAGTW